MYIYIYIYVFHQFPSTVFLQPEKNSLELPGIISLSITQLPVAM